MPLDSDTQESNSSWEILNLFTSDFTVDNKTIVLCSHDHIHHVDAVNPEIINSYELR